MRGEDRPLSCLDLDMRGFLRTAQEFAARQKGLVTRRQLMGSGIRTGVIERAVASGTLIAVYRGVYLVGHSAPSTDASYLAAVLACGDDAAQSGLPAAYLLGLIRGRAPAPEVIAPTEKRIPGLRTKRCRTLDPRDVTTVRGIPTTTVPRTLTDIAGDLPLQALSKAAHEAGVRHRTTPTQVAAVLARRPNTPGAAKLRAVLQGEPVSLSRLESRFLELLREHGLPLPIANKVASGKRVDCRWPDHHLTVELDSYRFHNSRHSWEQDRIRERQAYARGDDFRRYAWADVFEDTRAMLRELGGLLP